MPSPWNLTSSSSKALVRRRRVSSSAFRRRSPKCSGAAAARASKGWPAAVIRAITSAERPPEEAQARGCGTGRPAAARVERVWNSSRAWQPRRPAKRLTITDWDAGSRAGSESPSPPGNSTTRINVSRPGRRRRALQGTAVRLSRATLAQKPSPGASRRGAVSLPGWPGSPGAVARSGGGGAPAPGAPGDFGTPEASDGAGDAGSELLGDRCKGFRRADGTPMNTFNNRTAQSSPGPPGDYPLSRARAPNHRACTKNSAGGFPRGRFGARMELRAQRAAAPTARDGPPEARTREEIPRTSHLTHPPPSLLRL